MKGLCRLAGIVGLLMWAQENGEERSLFWTEAPYPALKIQPLALADPFQYTLQGGLEFPFARNSLQIEGGWVFGHAGEGGRPFSSEEGLRQNGFKVRVQWREYLGRTKPPSSSTRVHTGGYVALMATVQGYTQDFGEVDTSLFSPAPAPPISFQRRILGLGGGLLVGYQGQIGTHLVMDVWGGMGVRYNQHSWEPFRPSAQSRSLLGVGDFILRPGGRPIPYLGLALGWILH